MDIGVVIVTFNRIEKLKQTLELFEKQSKKPSYLLVVDNASTDGTQDFLKLWNVEQSSYKRMVIYNKENLGGSGGFNVALNEAMKLSAEWIWVSDDDAFPAEDALEESYKYIMSNEGKSISAICGTVINNGCIDYSHRTTFITKGNKIIRKKSEPKDYEKRDFEINAFSYVGVVINKESLLKVGSTIPDYFIWFDDTEHSLRLSKVGKIFVVPAIKIYHNVNNDVNGLSWKTFYGTRNELDMYRRHFSQSQFRHFYFSKLFIVKCKYMLKRILRKNFLYQEIQLAGIRAAKMKKLGIDSVYRPGWKY